MEDFGFFGDEFMIGDCQDDWAVERGHPIDVCACDWCGRSITREEAEEHRGLCFQCSRKLLEDDCPEYSDEAGDSYYDEPPE